MREDSFEALLQRYRAELKMKMKLKMEMKR